MTTSLVYAALASGVVVATADRPFAWTAVGLALAAGIALALAPRDVRRRGLPLFVALAGLAIVAVAPMLAP